MVEFYGYLQLIDRGKIKNATCHKIAIAGNRIGSFLTENLKLSGVLTVGFRSFIIPHDLICALWIMPADVDAPKEEQENEVNGDGFL